MLYKNILLFIALSSTLYGTTTQDINAYVVASLKPLGFIAAAIADEVTETQVLLPDGVSEHNYSLRPSDIKRLQSANLVIWIGPDLEVFMQKSTGRLAPEKQVRIATLDEVKPLLIKTTHSSNDSHNHTKGEKDKKYHHGEYNMHLWFSPQIARLSATAIHDKLVDLMPQSRAKLDANLKDFEEQLAKTDKQVSTELAPLKGKGYFIFHDAYSYYEKHYGLTPLGYFTINPVIQPGAQRLHKIRTQLIEQKAICIFSEPQLRPAVVEAVSRGTPVRMGTLYPLGTNIQLSKASYSQFLRQLAHQYLSCLKDN